MTHSTRYALLGLLTLLYLPLAQAEGPDTLIAVASSGAGVKSGISNQLTKATHFLLFDQNGKFIESLSGKKSQKTAQITQRLASKGVTVIVAQNFESSQLDSLSAKGIIPIQKKGKAKQVVKDLLQCEEDSPAAQAK